MIILVIPLTVLVKDATLSYMGYETLVLGGSATSSPIRLYCGVSALHVGVQLYTHINSRVTTRRFAWVLAVRLMLPMIHLVAPLGSIDDYTCSYSTLMLVV